MAGTTELFERLDNDGETLAKRLCLAQNVFQSSQLPLQRKEESIINWLCLVAEKMKEKKKRKSLSDDVTKVWSTLQFCVSNSRLGVAEVRPSTKLNIVEVVSKHLERVYSSDAELLPVLESALCILGAKSFQVYFCSNILVCMKFASCLLKRLSDVGSKHAALCLRGVTSIQAISKQTILRNDLRIAFIDVLLLPLIKLLKFDENETSLSGKITLCIEQILFPKTSSDFTQFFAGLFKENQDAADQPSISPSSENQYPVPLRLLSVLKGAKNLLDEDAYVSLFSMVFKAFMRSFPKDSEPLVFETVVTLTYLVGFEVKNPKCKVPYSKLQDICSEFKWELDTSSYSVFHGIVHSLAGLTAISPSKEINGTRFSQWLQMLVESLFPLHPTLSAGTPFMKLISALLKLNPLVVRTNVKNILEAIMAKPLLDEDKPIYSTLISQLLSLHSKLSHIPSFFKDFLASLSNGFKKQQESGVAPPDHNTWLPPSFIQELTECATVMPSGSSIAALKVLLFNLSENCLKPYEQALEQTLPPPNGFMDVQVLIVCELKCAIIKGVRMLESCTTPHARQEFCSIINQLRQQLYLFGELLLKIETMNSILVSSFLNVAHHWAAQAILIEQYADAGREELLKAVQIDLRAECQTSSGIGIYSYMHPYLSSQQWESVYEKIVNIEGDGCKDLLLKLELQLLSALIMFNSTQSTLIQEVAKRSFGLMEQKLNGACSMLDKNTASSIIILAPLISVSELSVLSDCIAVSLIADTNENSVRDVITLLVEERLTAAGLICSVLSNLRRSLKVSKRKRDEAGGKLWKTTKAVLGKLDAETIIQEEIRGRSNTSEQLSSVLSLMASHLADVLSAVDGGQWQMRGEEFDLTSLSQHLHLLQSLPLAYFTSGTRAVIFLSLISVALDCSLLATSQMKDSILKQIFDHLLLGLYETKKHHGPSLSGYLDHGILISTLAYFVTNFNVGGGLLELLLEQALRQEQSQEQIIDKILLLRKEGLDNKPSKESWLLGTLLMKVSSAMKLKTSTNDPINKLMKARKKLAKSFEALLQHQVVNSEEGLQAFSLALDFNINAERSLNNLVLSFERFCVSAVSSLQSGQTAEQKAAEAFILTVCRYRNKLPAAVPESFIKDVWSHLALSPKLNEALLAAVIQSATEEETSFIMSDLLSRTQKAYITCGIKNGLSENISANIIEIWQLLLRKQNSPNKYIVVGLKALRDLFGLLIVGKLSHLQLLGFLNTVLSSTSITVDIHIVDFCFLVLHEVNLPNSTKEFIPVARQYLSVLSALFHHQSSLSLDCIPSLMQMLQHLVRQLANESRQRLGFFSAEGAELALIAFGLEKLVTIFTKPNMKRSFQKVAAYFVADIMTIFETITLCQSVKVHFENMVYAILSILDDHAIKFLLRILSPASTEIFKNLQQAYKKFHSYTGKV